MRVSYYGQSEDIDDDGFYTNDHEAERRALAEMGAPDTATMAILSIDPDDRDSALVEADVSESLLAWMRDNVSICEEGEPS